MLRSAELHRALLCRSLSQLYLMRKDNRRAAVRRYADDACRRHDNAHGIAIAGRRIVAHLQMPVKRDRATDGRTQAVRRRCHVGDGRSTGGHEHLSAWLFVDERCILPEAPLLALGRVVGEGGQGGYASARDRVSGSSWPIRCRAAGGNLRADMRLGGLVVVALGIVIICGVLGVLLIG